jgi:hypothetical protein
MKRFLLISVAALVVVSQADASEVRLFTPVTYEAGADVPDAVKDECRVDYKLQEQLATALRKYNKVLDTTDTLDGQVLRVTITQVHANPGAAFTGPKSISARAELIDNGKVVNSTLLHSGALSIPMISFKSTCSILDKATLKMAKRVAAWSRNPHAPIENGIDPDAEAPVESAASAASR